MTNKKTDTSVKALPIGDRPYEKCLERGTQALTDAELLAVILRTGTVGSTSIQLAEAVLRLSTNSDGLLGIHQLSCQELMKLKGVGKVKAIQIKCIGELSKRIAKITARERLDFTSPSTIAQYYMEQLRHEPQELLLCMMLDTKNHLLGERVVFKGTVNASLVSPREVFLAALEYRAVHLILVHNHPSGDPTPSKEDLMVTECICQAGELLGIRVLDHIIIGDCRYISFCEQELLE